MPFISKQEVAQKRQAIKAAFPNYKISVVGRHYSSIEVAIMSGPIQLLAPEYIERGNESVNPFYIAENFKTEYAKRDLLAGIYAIINSGNDTESYDGDYGTIPSFYTRIEIGKWDKSYEVVAPKETKAIRASVANDKFPNGYTPKIQYWIERMQKEAISGNIAGVEFASKKIVYFTGRQEATLNA